jgi:hypothetical protein
MVPGPDLRDVAVDIGSPYVLGTTGSWPVGMGEGAAELTP